MFYGLSVIATAFAIELYFVWHGHRSINPWFLRLVILGALTLALETFDVKEPIRSAPAIVILMAAIIIFWKIRR